MTPGWLTYFSNWARFYAVWYNIITQTTSFWVFTGQISFCNDVKEYKQRRGLLYFTSVFQPFHLFYFLSTGSKRKSICSDSTLQTTSASPLQKNGVCKEDLFVTSPPERTQTNKLGRRASCRPTWATASQCGMQSAQQQTEKFQRWSILPSSATCLSKKLFKDSQ